MGPEGRAIDPRFEFEIARAAATGFEVEDDERLDLSVLEIVGKLGERPRSRLPRIDVEGVDRRIELVVDPHAERPCVRQCRPDPHEASADGGAKVLRGGGDETRLLAGQCGARDRRAQGRGERSGHRLDRVRARRQTMVGEGACQRHVAFDRIEAEGGSISLAPVDEFASEADLIGPVAERIGFEGDHDIGFAETRSQPERLTVNRFRRIVVGILATPRD